VRGRLCRGLTVFVFHDVTDSPSPFQRLRRNYTSRSAFQRQIAWIRERFEIIPPTHLPQFGGNRELPANAALLTFDDAWAGVFHTALPHLRRLRVPSLCFLNMATVRGAPDLAAVRAYERTRLESSILDQTASHRIDHIVSTLNVRYPSGHEIYSFQGATATIDDLTECDSTGCTWFGSHLYHHWPISEIDERAFVRSFQDNRQALASLRHRLPGLALPWGDHGDSLSTTAEIAKDLDVRVLFLTGGRQNDDPGAFSLTRVWFPFEATDRRELWYAAHSARLTRRSGPEGLHA